MPQKATKKVKITGTISAKLTTEELVAFIKDQKNKKGDGELIRDMADIYLKFSKGQLIDATLLNLNENSATVESDIISEQPHIINNDKKPKNNVSVSQMKDTLQDLGIKI